MVLDQAVHAHIGQLPIGFSWGQAKSVYWGQPGGWILPLWDRPLVGCSLSGRYPLIFFKIKCDWFQLFYEPKPELCSNYYLNNTFQLKRCISTHFIRFEKNRCFQYLKYLATPHFFYPICRPIVLILCT